MKSLIKSIVLILLAFATLSTILLTTPQVVNNDLAQTQKLEIIFGGEKANAYEIPSPINGNFEIWLFVDNNINIIDKYVGHVWIALVVTGNGKGSQVIATRSFNPGTNLTYNNPFEMNIIRDYINGNKNGRARRVIKVDRARANFIMGNPGYAGCDKYDYSRKGTFCNCAKFATRYWHYMTREDLKFSLPVDLRTRLQIFCKT